MENCNCLEKMRKRILEKKDISTISTRSKGKITSVRFSREITSLLSDEIITGQGVEIEYEVESSPGTTVSETKIHVTHISHEYCPWCGKKYQKGETPE